MLRIWEHFKRGFLRVLYDNAGKIDWWSLDPFDWTGKQNELSLFPDVDPSRLEDYKIPDFQEDPDYRKSQDFLSDLGIGILEGDIPEYFSEIGETGGPEFENYLNLMTGDIERAGLEAGAAIGRGGPGVQDAITRSVGEFSTKSRYANYLRSLEGKEFLFGEGRGITEGVRGAGQTQGQILNTYNLNKSTQEIGIRKYLDQFDIFQDEQQEERYETFGELLSLSVNAGVGFAMGGPAGAVAGAAGGIDWASLLSGATNAKAAPTTTGTDISKRISLGGISSQEPDIQNYLSLIKGRG